MDATPFEKIALWSGGKLAAGDPRGTVTTVCTDSRSLKAGDLFVALRGETKTVPNIVGFPNQHYNSITSWGIDAKGEIKHVYA